VTQGGYGNEVAPQILEYMENYTHVSYPLDKLDQVAIPDFAANAMENWGMINYR
jgi:aminopeptidase N